MDATTLRRLLADRDGGALSEDVIALLDAHAKLSPSIRSEIDEYSAITRDTRKALETRDPIALPAFPREAVTAALKTDTSRSVTQFQNRSRLMGFAAAACVVFAFFAGRLSHMSRMPEGETQQVAVQAPARGSNAGIWSIDAARRSNAAGSDSTSASFKWNSPLEWSMTRRL